MDIILFYLTADVMSEGVSFLPSLFDQVFVTRVGIQFKGFQQLNVVTRRAERR